MNSCGSDTLRERNAANSVHNVRSSPNDEFPIHAAHGARPHGCVSLTSSPSGGSSSLATLRASAPMTSVQYSAVVTTAQQAGLQRKISDLSWIRMQN